MLFIYQPPYLFISICKWRSAKMCKPPYKFVLPSSDSLFQTIFRDICSQRPSRRNSASCGQRNRIMGVSPALLALIGKYHYPHTFHRRLWLLSKGLWLVFIARFFKVMADITFGCRDFIPTVWLTYLQSWYSVVKILSRKFSELVSSIFPFTTYWQRNWDL